MNFKKNITLFALAGLSISLSYGQATKKVAAKAPIKSTKTVVKTTIAPTWVLKNAHDSLSYALGADIARSLKSNGFELDLNTLIKGLSTSFRGEQTVFSETENTAVIEKNIRIMMEKKNTELKKSGQDFLAALKNKPAIKATPQGVLYEVLVEGTGKQANASNEVKVHYAGYLIDGTKFDSSYDRGQPIDLSLNQVIEGWKIGVPLMKVGAKYKFYIPYNLAYGERGSGQIPPFSTLVFEIELLDVMNPDAV